MEGKGVFCMPSKRDAMTARALALVGCGYIYGATGWICTRARMEQQMRQYPAYAGQIVDAKDLFWFNGFLQIGKPPC